MDKNEFKVLIEKVNTLQAQGKTKAALDLLDAENWRKVHNVNSLLKVAEIYENAGRLDEAMEILWMARDRSRIARAVISRLALLCIKMEEYDEAQEFLEEYIDVAPHDSQQFVIRYELAKAKGSDDATLIAILEELKNNDFLEDRGYELALLYKKTGQLDKCMDLCDEIILWFGEGPYVEKAMELKKTIGSLSQEQEELYRKLKYNGEDEIREISLPDDMPQVTVDTDRFATVNLQEEIKKNIAEIIGTSEEETESVYKNDGLIHNIPYSQGLGDTKEIRIEKKEIEVATAEERRKTIEDAVRTMDAALRETEEALAEMDKDAMEQTRVEALAEAAEITKRLGELQLMLETGRNEEDRGKEEELRGAADQLREMAKVIEGGSSEPIDYKKAGALVSEVNTLLQEKIARLTAEEAAETAVSEEAESSTEEVAEVTEKTASFDEVSELTYTQPMEAVTEAAEENAAEAGEQKAEEPAEEQKTEETVEEAKEPAAETEEEPAEQEVTEEAAEEASVEPAEESQAEEESADAEEMQASDETDAEAEAAEEPDMSWAETPDQLAAEQAEKEAPKKDDKTDKAEQKEKGDPLQEAFEKKMTIAQWTTIFDPVPDDVFGTKYSAAVEGEQYTLTAEEKEVFDYMAPIDGMETKVGGALACAKRFYGDPKNTDGHIVISGNAGSGRTTLAMGLVQVLQKEIHKPRGPVGRINAQKLNDKDVVDVFRKVKSGVLIIEKAGSMHKSTVRALNMLMRTDRSNILVIIEDTREEIAKLLRNNKDFADRFGRQVDIPIFTNDELVNFARSYAKEKKCVIDEMAALALYNRINMIQRQGHATTLSDIQEVMDEAIASANKRGLFGGKKKDSEGRLILREKNFAAK